MSNQTPPAKKKCLECEEYRRINDFYKHDAHIYKDKKYPICKPCIKSKLKLDDPFSQIAIESVKSVMLEMNRPFIYSLWITSIEEAKKTGKKDVFGLYKKNVDQNNANGTWKDSEFEDNKPNVMAAALETEIIDTVEVNDRNKDDVLRMLGYDPFEGEALEDKRHLYNKLVDMLDESTLEDGFKLPAVIEIVKGFNQIDKINRALAIITADTVNLSQNVGNVKSLIDSKEKIFKSLLALAKDNGISVNHNNNKSKGAGTLSGIIKTLQEKGFEEGEVNLFDVETAQGIRQVADLSNQSIVAQLQFDENDYTSMILEQREIIQELDSKVSKFEEENRLLKKELMKYRKLESDIDE